MTKLSVKKRRNLSNEAFESQEVREYVELCYMGTEKRAGKPLRRVFLWETEKELLQGNAEGFAEHLMGKFQIPGGYNSVAALVHRILCDLGYRLRDPGPVVNPGVGGSKKSEPEVHVVAAAL